MGQGIVGSTFGVWGAVIWGIRMKGVDNFGSVVQVSDLSCWAGELESGGVGIQ